MKPSERLEDESTIVSAALDLGFIIEAAGDNLPVPLAAQLPQCRFLPIPDPSNRNAWAAQMGADIDRMLVDKPGWDWYCLGRAAAAYRLDLHAHRQRDASETAALDSGLIGRAALGIPSEEARQIPSLQGDSGRAISAIQRRRVHEVCLASYRRSGPKTANVSRTNVCSFDANDDSGHDSLVLTK